MNASPQVLPDGFMSVKCCRCDVVSLIALDPVGLYENRGMRSLLYGPFNVM